MNVPDLSGGNVSGVSGVSPPCPSDLIALAAVRGPVLTEEPANHDGEPVFVMDWPDAPPVEPGEPSDD